MIYQHPLAYFLAMEGVALLRGWTGDYDETFVRERLDDVRRLVADEGLAAHPGVVAARGSLTDSYRAWASSYDEDDNALFAADEPIPLEILDGLEPGNALDAACGTGRLAAALSARGHRVVGFDASAQMIAISRRQVPEAAFGVGLLEACALSDRSVDLVVCSLALTHLPQLSAVFAEFARVLRPGGNLVISDIHHQRILLGSVVRSFGPNGEPGLAPTFRHSPGDYLRAALSNGFEVRRCEEPLDAPVDEDAVMPDDLTTGEWSEWPWSLLDLVPAAANAAWDGPLVIVWHFRLGAS